MKGMSLIASGRRNSWKGGSKDRMLGSRSTGFYGFRRIGEREDGRRRCQRANDEEQIFRILCWVFSSVTTCSGCVLDPEAGRLYGVVPTPSLMEFDCLCFIPLFVRQTHKR